MKASELEKIREMSENEMQSRLKDLKTELFNLRFQHAINQLENPMRLKAVKKEIAIIKTILRENELKNSAEA
ncbi:MAG: 50S ribosomal protein L29 [Oscillospiraceae bacterium]|mgnify:FL=1|jgi:large subunit ribosomal protein L29|nr:50S ribosomal protein L29 [Oscillospiraceae bacterium]